MEGGWGGGDNYRANHDLNTAGHLRGVETGLKVEKKLNLPPRLHLRSLQRGGWGGAPPLRGFKSQGQRSQVKRKSFLPLIILI